ncbi:hypothetical protein [Thalassococcus lentus]|uniref:Uncharacterized protein n=1 Tax=Thalassococcus lentus TaxID=1210524 RepID=A0ABT4XQM5_9RHOB|nr:hypothetical protein [Thalassococcus lentus]MDA7424205.1 hypothetical protein [Thalassococcus lentus]
MSADKIDETQNARQERLSRLFDLHRQVLDGAREDSLSARPTPATPEHVPNADFARGFLDRATNSLKAKHPRR